MAIDHFEKHKRKSQTDWNFNVVFDSHPALAALVKHYEPALRHPGLYDPIPLPWLHATVLRVGMLEEYTEDEMLAVAAKVQATLANVSLPEFQFDSWWLWSGNVVFHISPDDQFTKIYDAVIAGLRDVVGEARTTKTPYGQFVAHTALAYTRSHDTENEVYDKLMAISPKPTSFKAMNLSLIKQWPTDGHYEWEVVQKITIGTR